jgi:hypothetical protein
MKGLFQQLQKFGRVLRGALAQLDALGEACVLLLVLTEGCRVAAQALDERAGALGGLLQQSFVPVGG